jgi:DNA-binding response OmpR family regulator
VTASEKKHVLVVEDDWDAREIYGAVLRHRGHDVTCVGTVRAGHEAARARRPDVVILDCNLPDGNGLGLLATWRKPSSGMADVPVIVVTAFSERDHIDAATRAGADAFVVKPCPPDALLAFLERAVLASKPTRKLPRYRMSASMRAPPIVFPCGRGADAATLHRLDATRYQALCAGCLRPSPVVHGDVYQALREVVALGWTTNPTGGGWTCPICRSRSSTRGAA